MQCESRSIVPCARALCVDVARAKVSVRLAELCPIQHSSPSTVRVRARRTETNHSDTRTFAKPRITCDPLTHIARCSRWMRTISYFTHFIRVCVSVSAHVLGAFSGATAAAPGLRVWCVCGGAFVHTHAHTKAIPVVRGSVCPEVY